MASYSTEQAAREAFAIIRAELDNYPWEETGTENWCKSLRLMKYKGAYFPNNRYIALMSFSSTVERPLPCAPNWMLLSELEGAGYIYGAPWEDPNHYGTEYEVLECIQWG